MNAKRLQRTGKNRRAAHYGLLHPGRLSAGFAPALPQSAEVAAEPLS
jgi:hypothetical protein